MHSACLPLGVVLKMPFPLNREDMAGFSPVSMSNAARVLTCSHTTPARTASGRDGDPGERSRRRRRNGVSDETPGFASTESPKAEQQAYPRF